MAIKRDDFPLPDVEDPLTAPFFAGAARGELVITRCETCGRFVWYPQEACPRDGGSLTWTAVSGRGTLFSWAVVRRAFLPAFEDRVPFVTALVALCEDPAVRLCTYVVGTAPDELVADAPVTATFRPLEFTTVPGRSVVVPMFALT
ncbi:MAG TPA: OB-fold domain-containing protein [Acidimicrobiia bacterium]